LDDGNDDAQSSQDSLVPFFLGFPGNYLRSKKAALPAAFLFGHP
jgi:hypothetical protein